MSRRRPIPIPQKVAPSKSKGSKKSVAQALGKGAEKYDLTNNLVQESACITFGKIAHIYIDNIRKDLRKVLTDTMKRSYLNVAGEYEEEIIPPERHQLEMLTVYSEPVYAFLDSFAIPDSMSERLAKRFKLEIESTDRIIIVADET